MNPYTIAKTVYDIGRYRSLAGRDQIATQRFLQSVLPDDNIENMHWETGEVVGDWTVPTGWECDQCTLDGNEVWPVYYSTPFEGELGWDDLQQHVFSAKGTTPYVTSYYKRRWGVCVPDSVREGLKSGKHEVLIRSRFTPTGLDVLGCTIHGKTPKEIYFSTYTCHPQMALDNAGSVGIAVALANWIASEPRKYTYHFLFGPETIGAIAYIHRYRWMIKPKIVAGYALTCLGSAAHSDMHMVLPPHEHCRRPDTEIHVVPHSLRGSDERQWCHPAVDMPVCGVHQVKPGTFPQYHTADDNMEMLSPYGCQVALDRLQLIVKWHENGTFPRSTTIGEPMLRAHRLCGTLGRAGIDEGQQLIRDVLAYADGMRSVKDIAKVVSGNVAAAHSVVEILADEGLVVEW